MPVLVLDTIIQAPIERCFDLARSIDLHIISTSHTGERAVAGKTSGLIALNETVTWEAVHFGVQQRLTSIITVFERPTFFRDEQVKGAFSSFRHDHIFTQKENCVCIQDVFEFHSPLGLLGRLADQLILKRYMRKLLEQRNSVIKTFAESDLWQKVL